MLKTASAPFKHKKASDEMKFSHLLPEFLNSFKALLLEKFLPSHMNKNDLTDIEDEFGDEEEIGQMVDSECKIALLDFFNYFTSQGIHEIKKKEDMIGDKKTIGELSPI